MNIGEIGLKTFFFFFLDVTSFSKVFAIWNGWVQLSIIFFRNPHQIFIQKTSDLLLKANYIGLPSKTSNIRWQVKNIRSDMKITTLVSLILPGEI